MRSLESIVASLELCKKIPAGEFEDTALVWYRYRGEDKVCPREQWIGFGGMTPVPAPTLSEILGKIPDCAEVIRMKEHNHCMRATGLPHVHDSSLANCAIRLWLRMKGIELDSPAEKVGDEQ